MKLNIVRINAHVLTKCQPDAPISITDIWELYMKIDSTGIIDTLNSLSLSDSEVLRTIILS